jgi:Rod binding domain-containing protein
MFEDMLDETLMERSSHRGVGLSDMMYKQLSAQMDKAYKIEKADENAAINAGSAIEEDSDTNRTDMEEGGEPQIKADGAETVEE